jgi:hypothetical protein
MAYQEGPVREFYTSILSNKRVAEIDRKTGSDKYKTVADYVRLIVSGEDARELKAASKIAGALQTDLKPVDLNTTCSAKLKS